PCEVSSLPYAGWHDIDRGNIISYSLQQSLEFISRFLVTLFSVLDRLVVLLVDGYNQLFDAEGPREVRMFPRLASRSNGYFELSFLCRDYQYSVVRLASSVEYFLD